MAAALVAVTILPWASGKHPEYLTRKKKHLSEAKKPGGVKWQDEKMVPYRRM